MNVEPEDYPMHNIMQDYTWPIEEQNVIQRLSSRIKWYENDEETEGINVEPAIKQSASTVLDPTNGKYLEYKDLIKTEQKEIWKRSNTKEMGLFA